MTLQQIRYFTVTARLLHYTEAARQLYITQPSLSYSLAELEKELGAKLFAKQGKKVSLTPCGEAFLPYAEQALRSLDDGIRQVDRALRLREDTVNLGYFYSMSFTGLPRLIERFQLEGGGSTVSFCFFQAQNERILEKLRRGELDLAFSFTDDLPQTAAVPVFTQELSLIVPPQHPLAGRTETALAALGDEKFVLLGKESHLRALTEKLFVDAGITPEVAFEAEECNAVASFVAAGFGIAILPELPTLAAYSVARLRLTDVPALRQVYLLRRTASPIPESAARFFEFVRDRTAEEKTARKAEKL